MNVVSCLRATVIIRRSSSPNVIIVRFEVNMTVDRLFRTVRLVRVWGRVWIPNVTVG